MTLDDLLSVFFAVSCILAAIVFGAWAGMWVGLWSMGL